MHLQGQQTTKTDEKPPYKYPGLDYLPKFAEAVMESFDPVQEAAGNYGEQSKPRGRKPKASKDKKALLAAPKASAKPKAKAKAKGKSKGKAKKPEKAGTQADTEDGLPEQAVPTKRKLSPEPEPEQPVPPAPPQGDVAKVDWKDLMKALEKDAELPLPPLEDLGHYFTPPEWVDSNNVYSAVYRVASKSGGKEEARIAGKLSTRIWRKYRVVLSDMVVGHSFRLQKPKARAKRACKPDVQQKEEAGSDDSKADQPEEELL